MTVYFNNRERKIRFRSEKKLIEWMRRNDPERSKDLFDFMEGYRKRKYLFEKIHLRTDSPAIFVSDLISNRIISIIK